MPVAEVIVALDHPRPDDARRLLDRLPGLRWAKVGPILFLAGGPPLVREIRSRGAEVFLDLKWHDIPNTVEGAVHAAVDLGVSLASAGPPSPPEGVEKSRRLPRSLSSAPVPAGRNAGCSAKLCLGT